MIQPDQENIRKKYQVCFGSFLANPISADKLSEILLWEENLVGVNSFEKQVLQGYAVKIQELFKTYRPIRGAFSFFLVIALACLLMTYLFLAVLLAVPAAILKSYEHSLKEMIYRYLDVRIQILKKYQPDIEMTPLA